MNGGGRARASLTSSEVTVGSVGAEQLVIGQGLLEHFLLLRVERNVIVLPLLFFLHDARAVAAKDGSLLFGIRASDCLRALFGALGGSGVRIFGLRGAALTLWGWGVGLGDVARVTVGVRVGWGGGLLGTTLLGGFCAGCDFSVSVARFGIGGFGLGDSAALLGGGFGGGRFIVVFSVAIGGSFGLGFFGGRCGGDHVVDDCACQELLFDGEEAGIG